MAIFRSERYPQLLVHTPAGKVRFVDGTAEVDGAQAAALRALGPEYGVEEVKAASPAKKAAKKAAPKPKA